jgi:hypothetical protein
MPSTGVVVKKLILVSALGTLALAVAGCAAPQAARAGAAAPAQSTPAPGPSSQGPASAPDPQAPAAAAPVTAAATPARDPGATSAPPHFATPDDAMRYLAAAYNAGDETAIRHVTTPDSRQQFEGERQWVKAFSFRDCKANGAPNWDYTCVLNIDAFQPGMTPSPDPSADAATQAQQLQSMDEVTLLVGAAATPGWYLEVNEGCGGG